MRLPFQALLHRLSTALPSQCAICHAWPAPLICTACLAQFASAQPRCPGCALPMPTSAYRCGQCLRTPNALDLCLASVPYRYPWDHVISQFKFRGQAGWGSTLAQLMRRDAAIQAALDQSDWVIPMPLAPQRLRERGFNQAHELARHLTPHKARPQWLLRTRETASQATLPQEQRQKNLHGAFALAPQAEPALQGRRVVLVDDVMTSGTTLYTAAQVLRTAGVAHITGLVLARTE